LTQWFEAKEDFSSLTQWFEAKDVNFDGYLDIGVLDEHGAK
jgi:hypothetical protein